MSEEQPALFDADELPVVEKPAPFLSIYVHFETAEDVAAFARAIGFPVTPKTKILAFPFDDLWPDRGAGALAATKPDDEEIDN